MIHSVYVNYCHLYVIGTMYCSRESRLPGLGGCRVGKEGCPLPPPPAPSHGFHPKHTPLSQRLTVSLKSGLHVPAPTHPHTHRGHGIFNLGYVVLSGIRGEYGTYPPPPPPPTEPCLPALDKIPPSPHTNLHQTRKQATSGLYSDC